MSNTEILLDKETMNVHYVHYNLWIRAVDLESDYSVAFFVALIIFWQVQVFY